MSENCPNFERNGFRIGPHTIRNRAWLAPMSGVSDVPFRKLAWKFGAGMVVSEMVASEALTTGQEEMRLKAEGADLPIHIVQLAGRDPEWMRRATRLAEGAGASIIDINMGCPSKRVTNGYSGSALMRDLDHAETLIGAVVETTDLPVTLKMRLGWDENSINAPELARRAQNAGIQMLTVHGRTRNQFYKGEANWSAVKAVREAHDLPMLVNGDICDEATAHDALIKSGADGVMIGRASYGAPWLVGQVGQALQGSSISAAPKDAQLADLVAGHYEDMLSFYGRDLGIRNARKHLDWYAAHSRAHPDFANLRQAMMKSVEPRDVLTAIRSLHCDLTGVDARRQAA